MKRCLLFSTLILSLLLSAPKLWSQCVSNEANIVAFELNGINYEIVKEKSDWESAAACAVERGGFLAEINSWDEQNGLFNALNNASISIQQTTAPDGGGAAYVWSGGNDRNEEGTWIWDGDNNGEGVHFWQGLANGTSVDNAFVFWGNEPDNFSNQDALGIALTDWPFGNAGQWNDIREINKLYYVIEYPDESSGFWENAPINTFNIFPNPAVNTLNFEFKHHISVEQELKIYNHVGQLLQNIPVSNTTISLDVEHLESGVYFIQYRSESLTKTQKVILL